MKEDGIISVFDLRRNLVSVAHKCSKVCGCAIAYGGLQAVDYFLWALQRLYERGEDRYWEYVDEKVSLVYDVDDTRENDYGTYYTKRNPLTLDECKKKSREYEDSLSQITRHGAEFRSQV